MDRTDRLLRLLIRLVVLPGFTAATYLTYTKLAHIDPVCSDGGCAVIQVSRWSEVFGIPVTLLGMITYVIIFASTFIAGDLPKLVAAFFATTGAAFSLWLQYQALFVMEHFCPWCFTSAVCMNLLAILTIWRALRLPKFDETAGADDLGDPATA
ncbi:MAG: vitamin K epoxide reductase family protein [Solirubrobacteraceae bacterium]|nr:vitamin K epoxide reductase family protein [Solirubrobacteraceae bacterium]